MFAEELLLKYISRAHHKCFCLFVFACLQVSVCDFVFPHPTVVGGGGGGCMSVQVE